MSTALRHPYNSTLRRAEHYNTKVEQFLRELDVSNQKPMFSRSSSHASEKPYDGLIRLKKVKNMYSTADEQKIPLQTAHHESNIRSQDIHLSSKPYVETEQNTSSNARNLAHKMMRTERTNQSLNTHTSHALSKLAYSYVNSMDLDQSSKFKRETPAPPEFHHSRITDQPELKNLGDSIDINLKRDSILKTAADEASLDDIKRKIQEKLEAKDASTCQPQIIDQAPNFKMMRENTFGGDILSNHKSSQYKQVLEQLSQQRQAKTNSQGFATIQTNEPIQVEEFKTIQNTSRGNKRNEISLKLNSRLSSGGRKRAKTSRNGRYSMNKRSSTKQPCFTPLTFESKKKRKTQQASRSLSPDLVFQGKHCSEVSPRLGPRMLGQLYSDILNTQKKEFSTFLRSNQISQERKIAQMVKAQEKKLKKDWNQNEPGEEKLALLRGSHSYFQEVKINKLTLENYKLKLALDKAEKVASRKFEGLSKTIEFHKKQRQATASESQATTTKLQKALAETQTKNTGLVAKLQETNSENEAIVARLEKEVADLKERLEAETEVVATMTKEGKAKDERITELQKDVKRLKLTLEKDETLKTCELQIKYNLLKKKYASVQHNPPNLPSQEKAPLNADLESEFDVGSCATINTLKNDVQCQVQIWRARCKLLAQKYYDVIQDFKKELKSTQEWAIQQIHEREQEIRGEVEEQIRHFVYEFEASMNQALESERKKVQAERSQRSKREQSRDRADRDQIQSRRSSTKLQPSFNFDLTPSVPRKVTRDNYCEPMSPRPVNNNTLDDITIINQHMVKSGGTFSNQSFSQLTFPLRQPPTQPESPANNVETGQGQVDTHENNAKNLSRLGSLKGLVYELEQLTSNRHQTSDHPKSVNQTSGTQMAAPFAPVPGSRYELNINSSPTEVKRELSQKELGILKSPKMRNTSGNFKTLDQIREQSSMILKSMCSKDSKLSQRCSSTLKSVTQWMKREEYPTVHKIQSANQFSENIENTQSNNL